MFSLTYCCRFRGWFVFFLKSMSDFDFNWLIRPNIQKINGCSPIHNIVSWTFETYPDLICSRYSWLAGSSYFNNGPSSTLNPSLQNVKVRLTGCSLWLLADASPESTGSPSFFPIMINTSFFWFTTTGKRFKCVYIWAIMFFSCTSMNRLIHDHL